MLSTNSAQIWDYKKIISTHSMILKSVKPESVFIKECKLLKKTK